MTAFSTPGPFTPALFTPGRIAVLLAGLLVAAAALWLGRFHPWPADTAALAGRALLGVTGKGDLSILLAAYPPLPYVLLSLVQPLASLLGIAAPALLTALLAGGFAIAYAFTLRRARFGGATVAVLLLLFCAHPFALYSAARGPEAMLLLWGVWLYGLGLFGFRASGGVNDLILLTLSLPLLAFTSLQGAMIALAAVPFLLLAVPPPLLQRAYASVYSVMLFPLLFAMVSICILSWVLLHDPFAFLTPEMLDATRWSERPWWLVAAICTAEVIGTLIIVPGLIMRVSTRRPLQMAAGALLGTMALAAVLLATTGLAANAIEALAPAVAAAAITSARWPREPTRALRTTILMAIGLIIALSIGSANRAATEPIIAAVTGHAAGDGGSAEVRLGRHLAGRDGVMFDAIAHPAVVNARGSSAGLITATDPAFTVSLLKREIAAPHVVTREHRPGRSEDAIGRVFPQIHDRGPAGYRLSYDDGGWRVWSRIPMGGNP